MSIPKGKNWERRAGCTALSRAAAQPIWLVFAVVLVLAAAALWPAAKEIYGYWREDVFLAALLCAAGAEPEDVRVTGWVRVADWGPGRDPGEVAREAAVHLGLSGDSRVNAWQNRWARGVCVEGRTAAGHALCVKAQELSFPGGGYTAHLLVEVSGLKMWEAPFCRRAVRAALSLYGSNCRAAVEHAGLVSCGPDSGALEEGVLRVMEAAGAKVLERTVRDNLAALAGCTGRLAGGEGEPGIFANLGAVARRDPERGAVRLSVSTPVVFEDY